ncbi:xanthine dehydrogenase family Fe-S subunit [Prauserella muralis]|uniref:2Fe-2S ferredoxin n=1 Tax=Prauserella muralis TaxID=588067 RepID=A0A2V4AQH3_9PSEU|nr:2Fe-2S iron-sulfur cluster-binding protein [Prauserella muralis]PXY22873.1 2Fe-2S ferredoxin [Prauserella muralis]TWE28634.1 carbon-monoxide dehydrogenase small subunit [Prauserella muralis]
MTTSERTPRPVRAEAGDLVEVRLTVNGTPATLRLPARVTLSDALRDHLGLTGTHVGCEHGVCGMCTVLVDGQAARACLLFAVQLDGADIVTVEGLGRPDRLHPLQEAFGRNHALQCGFCTPGFLLSAYDLLATTPEVPTEELPQELSGVLCRCTGYRNIIAAVREAREESADGLPAPANCGSRALVGRAAGQAGHDAQQAAAGPEKPVAVDVVPPRGEPTVTVCVSTEVAVGSGQVWDVFDDIHLLARCLPGAELTEDLGGGLYAGRAKMAVGPVKLAFTGAARILEHDRASGRLRVLAQGRDTGGAQTQADIELRTEAVGQGTVLRADAKVYLTGRIAQFGRALAGDISRRMFEQFAASVGEAATSGRAPEGPVKPPGAIRLMLGTLLERLRPARRSRGAR